MPLFGKKKQESEVDHEGGETKTSRSKLFGKGPSDEQTVSRQQPLRSQREQLAYSIGYLCASNDEDWSVALRLCDEISTSEDLAKEAAKTLRKELELGRADTAARLAVIFMRNTSDRFRLQVANKKFLDAWKSAVESKRTSPSVKAVLLKALSVLAYECRNDPDLSAITNLYNKLKRPEDPINGSASDVVDPIFDPKPRTRSHRPSSRDPSRIDLWKEAAIAKNSAHMLIEALSFTKPDELQDNELVQEFYANLQKSQSIFVDALPWAAAEAEKATENRSTGQDVAGQPEADLPANLAEPTNEEKLLGNLLEANSELQTAFKMYDDVQRRKAQTQEDRLVHDRSIAEQRLSGPQQNPFHDEEADSQGASAGYLVPPALNASGSSSRSSPASATIDLPVMEPVRTWNKPPTLPAGAAPVAQIIDTQPTTIRAVPQTDPIEQVAPSSPPRASRNPYAAMTNTSPPLAVEAAPSQSNNPFARILQQSSPPLSATSPSDNADFPQSDSPFSESGFPSRLDEDVPATVDRNPFHRPLKQDSVRSRATSNGSSIFTPVEPSAKALGKMRRISGYQDESLEAAASADRQQLALETALREKYAANGRAHRLEENV